MKILAGISATFGFVLLLFIILDIAASWFLFKKAGRPGWAALIPFYNLYCVFDIALGPKKLLVFGIWIVSIILAAVADSSSYLSILSLLLSVGISIKINYSFNRRYASTGLAILTLILPIFRYVLAFGDYQYTPVEGGR